jgi:glutamyl-Q tRNA(Asp) synthetase
MSALLRFAPSPNGYLHLGHAYSALRTARWAEELGGTMLLRIEDIDTARCKPEFTTAIFEDLDWLGLTWPEPVMVQSQRFDIYSDAAAKIERMGLLYPCFCSRAEIAAHAVGHDPDGAPLYPGTCRHLSAAERDERLAAGERPAWRLNMQAAIALAGDVAFPESPRTDIKAPAPVTANPARWGDVILVRKDTPTSYHLSVVVDDAAQGITHVTRGEDMQAATDIHVLLQRLLGVPTPIYIFHPLLLDADGRKLAKSRQSQSLRDLKADGWTAEAVRRAVGFG